MIPFYSCKKEEEQHEYIPPPDFVSYASFSGRVLDSITGLPMANFPVSYYTSYFHDFIGSNYTDSNGYYHCSICLGGKLCRFPAMPPDNETFLVDASGKCGALVFKAGLLVEKDTISLPDIFVKPRGFLKTYLKDTSGINSDSLGLRYSYPFYYPYNLGYNIFPALVYNSWQYYGDTTMIRSAGPDQNILVSWRYKKNSIIYKDSILIPIISNDTSVVNILY